MTSRTPTFAIRAVLGGLLAFCVLRAAAAAQEAADGRLSVELNAVETMETGCALTFLIQNGHPDPIEAAVFETVLFDAQGQVERLTLFDFQALPSNRPRVRQFVVPGLACEAIGRVLFNGADTCTVAGQDSDICETGLTLSSRTDVEIIG